MTADVEDQDHTRGLLVCHRIETRTQWTYWPTVEQAREAKQVLTPCDRRCENTHSAVRVTAGAPPRPRVHTKPTRGRKR